jgi:hypothetical protein
MVSETFLLRVPSSKLSWRRAGLERSSCLVGVNLPELPEIRIYIDAFKQKLQQGDQENLCMPVTSLDSKKET